MRKSFIFAYSLLIESVESSIMADLNNNANDPQYSVNHSIVVGLTEMVLGGVEIGVGRLHIDDTITQIGVEAIQHGLFHILSACYPSETDQPNNTIGEQHVRIATMLIRFHEQGVYSAVLRRMWNAGHRAWVIWIQPRVQEVKIIAG